jgi:hypothetical protein
MEDNASFQTFKVSTHNQLGITSVPAVSVVVSLVGASAHLQLVLMQSITLIVYDEAVNCEPP